MAKTDKFVIHAAPRISTMNTTTVAINRIDAEWFDELKAYSGLNSPTLFRMMRIFCDAHMDMREDFMAGAAEGLSLTDTLRSIQAALERLNIEEE